MTPPMKQQCPCCGYYTLRRRGDDEICKVCFWQDDDHAEVFGEPAPERPRGPNQVHLWQGRENYQAFGSSEACLRQYVRPPNEDEMQRPE